jgi:asparagine synthase (glutamine-hydrolysing)
MCGIAGFQIFGKYKEFNRDSTIKKITDVLTHRGPDSSGFWKSDEDKIYMGHRRLSIVDLSVNGRQPMVSNNGRYVITFNGEIYNYRELKGQLESGHDVKFYNNTDTQVILELVSIFGIKKALEKLEGMFAFGIWDRKTKSTILARDRFGEKPLFYFLDNNILVFSSELKSIRTFFQTSKLDVNLDSTNYYSMLGYIPAPLTIYKKVFKVLPSEIIKISNGVSKKEKYWSIIKKKKNEEGLTYKENLSQIHNLLEESIKKMMMADVEVGCFLSGGIDSSLIASLAQKNSIKKIKTFTVGFKEEKYNEAMYAKKISEYIGSDHNEIIVSIDDMINNIEGIVDQFDEPFADSSCLPTEIISKFASKNLKVVLSGDGGDEIFLGYNRYLYAKKIEFLSSFTSPKTRFFLQKIIDYLPTDFLDRLSSPFQKTLGLHGFAHKMMKLSNIINYENNSDFYKRLCILDNSKLDQLLNSSNAIFSSYNDIDLIESIQRNDIDYYLLNDILTKVDRASMSNSLEVRSPFLSHALVEKAFKIPSKQKMQGSKQKIILKDILGKYLPKNLFDRPKMGFGIPIENWLRNDKMIKCCNDVFYDSDWNSLGYDKIKMAKIWSDYKKFRNAPASKIWSYLVSGLWINRNITN